MKIPFFSSAPTETKKSRGFKLHMTGMQPALWRSTKFPSYAKEGYEINVVAHSAINRIARAVSSLHWQVRLPSGEVLTEDHPYLDLIRRPNPIQSGSEWWQARITYLLLSGNNYDEIVTGSREIPVELWVLRPDRMTVIEGPNGIASGYNYKVGNKNIRFKADSDTGESAIQHTRLFSPLDDWYGLSAVSAAAYAIDQHNESMNWIQSLLQNSARPSGALVVDKEAGLSDEEFNRIANEVEQKYSGSSNAGRPMLLEGGLDWKAMGLSPVDMEILRTKDSAARDISLAFGVPPLLLNIPGDNTYANYREARLGFYEDTILPFIGNQVETLNNRLSSFFDNAVLEPNKDKIEAIADKRMKQWEMADKSDDITLNESRAMKGLPELPEPLGSMLMVDVRSRATAQPETDTEEQLKAALYDK